MSLMGSLWTGVSGLQSSNNALNTTAHNMSNLDTEGYTRQQVAQGTRPYVTISTGRPNWQQIGLHMTRPDHIAGIVSAPVVICRLRSLIHRLKNIHIKLHQLKRIPDQFSVLLVRPLHAAHVLAQPVKHCRSHRAPDLM